MLSLISVTAVAAAGKPASIISQTYHTQGGQHKCSEIRRRAPVHVCIQYIEHTWEYSRQSFHFRTPVMSREQRPSMAATTAGICSWSPSTHSTTAPAMVALMMTWSRLMGPIWRSASRACFGASGVSFTSGGTSCTEPKLQSTKQLKAEIHTHKSLLHQFLL